jgi:glyoxalase family protein
MSSNNNVKGVFGIHHVTAITSNPQKNIDFYTGDSGLRLVKLTVNQDDPTAYHLYYGDELGRPGTILTFFHWPNIPRGRRGTSPGHCRFLFDTRRCHNLLDRQIQEQTDRI